MNVDHVDGDEDGNTVQVYVVHDSLDEARGRIHPYLARRETNHVAH